MNENFITMIKYYWIFDMDSFMIAKIIDLDEDLGLVSFDENKPSVIPLCDFKDDHDFFKSCCTHNYVTSQEISEEKYNNLKKFLKL